MNPDQKRHYERKHPKPIVAILVPCYKQPEPDMAMSLQEMIQESKDVCAVFQGPGVRNSSVVHWTRNLLLANLLKSGQKFTHVLFVDDDIVIPSDSLVKLLGHKKDIIGGLCTKRVDPPIPNARVFDEKTFDYNQVWEWQDELIEVDAVGTGLILISREALEKVANSYFACDYEREVFGMSDEKTAKISQERAKRFDRSGNGWWFRFLPGLHGGDEYGEDISFCLVAKRYCHIPVFVDTTVRPGHIGKYAYSVEDFLPYRDQKMEEARREGNYITPPKAIETEPMVTLA